MIIKVTRSAAIAAFCVERLYGLRVEKRAVLLTCPRPCPSAMGGAFCHICSALTPNFGKTDSILLDRIIGALPRQFHFEN